MKFGEVSVSGAEDAILAHTTRGATFTLKKGHRLTRDDCQVLVQSGLKHVSVVQLEDGDIHEDDAAARIAQIVTGPGISPSAAFTGRCNLLADGSGLVRIDSSAVNRLNAIDESITIATLSDLAKAEPGQTVATIKIIPFAVSTETMERVQDVLADIQSIVELVPFQSLSVSIINTTLPALKESVLEKTTDLTTRRVASVGGQVKSVLRCAHDESAVAETVKRALKQDPGLVLIVGASVTVDRADVVPAGLIRAGGELVHFGMPVDPGNLMLLADCDSVPVLVLPGCARSPKLNGIDWMLERFSAGLKIGRTEIVAMGVGGLLVDSPMRPLPRDEAVRAAPTESDGPNIAAIILAAGQSRRMGGVNKLMEPVGGVPLIRRTVDAALASDVGPISVVTGHEEEKISQVLDCLPVTVIHNPDYADGLSSSLRCGLAALPEGIDGAVVCLGDMPAVLAKHINALVAGFAPEAGHAIGVPVHNGKRGNPVLWARRFFPAMTEVHGDVGARHLIGDYPDLVYEVEFGDTAVLTDLDTPEEWSRYRAGHNS